MAGEEGKYKTCVTAAVHELCQLIKNDDFWIKSEDDGRDVLVLHKYQQAFPWWSYKNINKSSSWTTQASRASAIVLMDDLDLANLLSQDDWSYRFPNIVAKDTRLKLLSPGSSEDDDNPHGTLRMVYKEMQATSPMVANRKFTILRSCIQIDEGTWVIAEISQVRDPTTYSRLPSGCLIQRISDKSSKVTWVEHMKVEESLPNQTLFYDHLIRSGFAFGAERMVAWLERSCERWSHKNDTCHAEDPCFVGKEAPWILEKLCFMEFGETMVRGLFQNVSPNEDSNSTLWRSVTGSEDLKVYASLYKSSANFEVAGGVVAFSVRHSPEFVLETLGNERTHHEWDVLGGHRKLCTLRKYSTGGDSRNTISASMIHGSSNEMLIKEVNVNLSGSLVVWSTVSKKVFDLIRLDKIVAEDSVLISGFVISTDGHTTGGSVITLVLRMLVEGNQPLQEKTQQSGESITFAINQTVGKVKEALEIQHPPSPPPTVVDPGFQDKEKSNLMRLGNKMVKGLFDQIGPNADENSSILPSFDDFTKFYRVNNEVVGGVVTFYVTQSPDFVLKILGNVKIRHEWDYLGGLRKLQPFVWYPTGEDPRNTISLSKMDDEDIMLIQEVTVDRARSLVVWSTLPRDASYCISLGLETDIPLLVSGFVIRQNGHTTANNMGGSVVTLVLRKFDDVDEPLEFMDSLPFPALEETVKRVKEALEKPRLLSPPTGI